MTFGISVTLTDEKRAELLEDVRKKKDTVTLHVLKTLLFNSFYMLCCLKRFLKGTLAFFMS